jgi:MYXO-CTERM domain-containing protein
MSAKLRHKVVLALGVGLGVLTSVVPIREAAAFCGFYVAGADAKLYNDATMVVLMRDGERTVLSMQNDYQGPPENFALVIPVPVVLREGDVRTLPKNVFDHVDKLAAPRLVEYWEQDPCAAREMEKRTRGVVYAEEGAGPPLPAPADGHGVTIEAQFVVGEYEVVILSAEDSTGLDTWLREQKYNIPGGAEPVLRPYVEGGMKFFVAKVDVSKVTFAKGPDGVERAQLSPLRFHYDSPDFSLPVRLGLINAKGPQDLLIHILAPNQRYEVANYPNTTIPTNLVVKDQVREHFGQFYVSLFDHTLAQHPGAVVTEYAWSASSCDPCPEPPLEPSELITLGADVLPRYAGSFDPQGQLLPEAPATWQIGSEFTLTRLHARYDASSLGEDLVFRTADGLSGGQGMPSDYKLDPSVSHPSGWNAFQGRYTILHRWEGPVKCMRPLWDQWGGPPAGGAPQPAVARQLAFVPRDGQLSSFVTASAHTALQLAGPPPDEPEAKQDNPPAAEPADGKSASDAKAPAASASEPARKGCTCSTEPGESSGAIGLALLGLLAFVRRSRRETQP